MRNEQASVPPIAVDFETHYAADYSVKELGNRAYCSDPRFNAWAVSTYDGEITWAGRPKDCDWSSLHGREWVSHNREFDKAVFLRLQRDKVIPENIAPAVWHCSAAACAFLQLPRDLKGACAAVLGEEPDKSFRKALKGRHDNDLFDALDAEETAYATQDAVLCWRLWQHVGPRWPGGERRLFELIAGKRGKRLGMRNGAGALTTSQYIAHHGGEGVICWRTPAPEELAELGLDETRAPKKAGRGKIFDHCEMLHCVRLFPGENRVFYTEKFSKATKVSQKTAQRFLDEMTEYGLLQKHGDSSFRRYALTESGLLNCEKKPTAFNWSEEG